MTSTPSDLELIRCSPINGCGQLKPRSRMYGVLSADSHLRAEQGYRCGICGISEADVDLTGLPAVRALMVNRCSRFRSP